MKTHRSTKKSLITINTINELYFLLTVLLIIKVNPYQSLNNHGTITTHPKRLIKEHNQGRQLYRKGQNLVHYRA